MVTSLTANEPGQMRPVLIAIITGLHAICGTASDLLRSFNAYNDYRWGEMFPSQSGGRLRAVVEDDTGLGEPHRLIEFVGFPAGGQTFCCHFQGSPLEACRDPELINQRLSTLINRYGRSSIRFVTLEGWASDQFQEALESHGFKRVERKPVMYLPSHDHINAGMARNYGPDFEMRRLTQKDAFWEQYLEHRPAPVRFMMSPIDETGIADPQSRYWCIVHLASQRCISTAKMCVHEGAGNLSQVSTLPDWRGLGLATSLIIRVLEDAYEHYPELGGVSLDASEMGATLYAKIGFETIGWLNAYQCSSRA